MSISRETESPPTGSLTYDDYARIPDDGNRHEIIHGAHYMNPAPIPYHQALSRHIQFQLYSALELSGLGEVINAPIDVQFSERDVVQPDVVVVLKDNSIITRTKINGVPDLMVEILSPSTSNNDLGLKKHLYEDNGVPEYWIVDPDEKVIQEYTLVDGAYQKPQTCADAITFGGAPDVRVDLTRVW
jgi:Uma2 family endonuclease